VHVVARNGGDVAFGKHATTANIVLRPGPPRAECPRGPAGARPKGNRSPPWQLSRVRPSQDPATGARVLGAVQRRRKLRKPALRAPQLAAVVQNESAFMEGSSGQ
jgi:hypothetical protein